jgi:hypothetical protein
MVSPRGFSAALNGTFWFSGPGDRRSHRWLDQRLRAGQFVLPDGTVVRPLRSPGGYRRFTTETLKDVAICSYNHRWFSMDKLKSALRELAMAAYRDTGFTPS